MHKKKTADLVCPKCKKDWAVLRWTHESSISPSDVKPKIGKKKFKSGDSLACSACNYEYNNWDVYAAIAASAPPEPVEE